MVTTTRQKRLLEDIKSPLSLSDRILITSTLRLYEGTIHDVVKVGEFNAGIRTSSYSKLIVPNYNFVKANVNPSIPNGTDIVGLYIRPIIELEGNHVPMGYDKIYEVVGTCSNGLIIKADSSDKHGFVFHNSYRIVPKYKIAWVFNDNKLTLTGVRFQYTKECYGFWKTDDGEYIIDTLVHEDFTDACDIARRFTGKRNVKINKYG